MPRRHLGSSHAVHREMLQVDGSRFAQHQRFFRQYLERGSCRLALGSLTQIALG